MTGTSVIVAGRVYVDPAQRDEFVAGMRIVVERARNYPGCLDLAISPDPIEPGRVNIFEHFESREALDAWRAKAPAPEHQVALTGDQMAKHDVARSGPPFD